MGSDMRLADRQYGIGLVGRWRAGASIPMDWEFQKEAVFLDTNADRVLRDSFFLSSSPPPNSPPLAKKARKSGKRQ